MFAPRTAVAGIAFAILWIVSGVALAQQSTPSTVTFTKIYTFGQPQGPATPSGGFILGSDGNFYGTSLLGGSGAGNGTLYKVSTSGALQVLHSFNGATEGGNPQGPLAMDPGGTIYGTTKGNTAFSYTATGVYTALGALPGGMFNYTANGLVFESDGNLYGTSMGPDGGLLFRLTPQGTSTLVLNFGAMGLGNPSFFLAGPGDKLYGLLYGPHILLVSITLDGMMTTVADLSTVAGGVTFGQYPGMGLALGSDGNFYIEAAHAMLQVTPTGGVGVSQTDPTTGEFLEFVDGLAPVMQGTDGYLYLVNGDVYQIEHDLTFTQYVLATGAVGPGGSFSALAQGPDGTLYAVSDGGISRITLMKGSSSNSGGGSSGSTSTSSAGDGYPDDGSGQDYGVTTALGDPSDIAGSLCSGDPVCVASGNLYATTTDYQTSGMNQLAFTRYYNSIAASNTFATALGPNWRSNYDRYLRIGVGSVIAERPDGQQVTFTHTAGLVWTTDRDIDLQLVNSGSRWVITDSNDNNEIYTAINAGEGLLQSIQARNGYTQTLQYGAGNQLASVTDSYNRSLSFAYSGGQLQTVTTPDDLVLSYGYNGNLLTSVGYSTTPATSQTYLYENAALPYSLTGILDENGNRQATWTYDVSGRVVTSQNGAGAGLTTFAYNPDGTRMVTNALGEQEIYKFTSVLGVSKVAEIDRIATAGLPAATRKFTYDASGYVASQTDWNGNLTTFVNDARGEPTTINEAVGTPQARSTNITYHPIFHLPVQIVMPGITTTYKYDFNGELLTKTETDTTTALAPYSTSGQTRTWTYTWSNYLMASSQNPRTDVTGLTQYTYDASGALISTTNALGQATQISRHLPGGLPLASVDPNGVTTTNTYDTRQHLLSKTVSTGGGPLTTSYTYDAAEELLAVTLPDGSGNTNSYDAAHRLIGSTNLFGENVAYTLDALGDQTQANTVDANGNLQRTHSATFDALGRLQQDTGGAGQTTSYTYDSNGNAITITDSLGRVTKRTYDALNRLVSVTDANGGVTTTTYDSHGRTLTVTDPNGSVTSYAYDGFGDLIQRVSPDTGKTVYYYDADGNRTQQVDARGAVTMYAYDALDRRISVSYPADATENVTYTYDQGNLGIGRLTGATDAAGTLTRTYDERGNLLTDARDNGAADLVTAYTYDAVNRLASITYPSGWMATYARDAMGRTTSVMAQAPDGASNIPVLTNVAYQPFGPVNGLAFGNGIIETRSFDPDYRITGLSDIGANIVQYLNYTFDAANNVSSIANGVNPANGQNLRYDNLNRLIGAAGSYGSYSYTFDAMGNRLTETAGGSTMTYSYAARSNQLAAMTAAGAMQAIGYDAAGNITSFGSGMVSAATYTQAGQLAAVLSGSNLLAQYTYDAFGQRVGRVGAVTATTFFQYDSTGHLLEETDGEGNAQVDYIYLGQIPIATISPSAGQVYFLHNDRLGTPQVASDANQNIVWTANYGPFGEMAAVPGLIVQNLRLPGQEFDANTGFYHNGFRDYAPMWGRYLESDPMGIQGGMNTYAYGQSNPQKFTDRQGLSVLAEGLGDALGYGVEKGLESWLIPKVGETWSAIIVGGSLQVASALPLAGEDLAACAGTCWGVVAVGLGLEFAYGALKAVAEDNIAENTLGLLNSIGSLSGSSTPSLPESPTNPGTAPPGDGFGPAPPPPGSTAPGAVQGPVTFTDLGYGYLSSYGNQPSATSSVSLPCGSN